MLKSPFKESLKEEKVSIISVKRDGKSANSFFQSHKLEIADKFSVANSIAACFNFLNPSLNRIDFLQYVIEYLY